MANHKSAEKRNRQRIKETLRNGVVRSHVRSALKRARAALAAGVPEAAELVRAATRMLDRSASKQVLPHKRVSRYKSRLAAQLHKLTSG